MVLLCGPWYLVTAGSVIQTFVYPAGCEYIKTAVTFYPSHAIGAFGLGLFPVMAAGVVDRVVRPLRNHDLSGRWAAMTALILSVCLFHSVVPAGYEGRYLVVTTPVQIMFLVAGVNWAARLLPSHLSLRMRLGVLTLALALVFATQTFEIPKKGERGFIRVAKHILAAQEFNNSVILVSSEADGEGMLISEIAMHEKRPGHVVLRATKALAQIDWIGTTQRQYYASHGEVLKHLDEIPVGLLVLDMAPGRVTFEHHRLLRETLATYPERFQLVTTDPGPGSDERNANQIRLYRVIGNENPAPGTVMLDKERLLTRGFGPHLWSWCIPIINTIPDSSPRSSSPSWMGGPLSSSVPGCRVRSRL